MTRAAAAVLIGLLAAASARADALPPPAPPGKKYAKVEVTLTTDKTYPDYEFYARAGAGYKKVEFGPAAPVTFTPLRGFRPPASVLAVPKGAAAAYPAPKDFADALRAETVAGQLAVTQRFPYQALIDAKDPRTVVVETYAVESVDAKDGIKLKAVKAAPPGEKKNAPDDDAFESGDGSAVAHAPRGGTAIAGLAAALAVALAGLWLVRRARA